MLGRPSQRKGWNFTLLYGENINVVADTSGTTNAQRLNAAFIHHFYCDGVFWYYQGRFKDLYVQYIHYTCLWIIKYL